MSTIYVDLGVQQITFTITWCINMVEVCFQLFTDSSSALPSSEPTLLRQVLCLNSLPRQFQQFEFILDELDVLRELLAF